MPLKIVNLPTTRMLWLSGTVRGQRIRESTGTDNPGLAEERRAVREAEVYRAGIHGLKMVRPFAEVALSYLKRPRSDDTRWRLGRFLVWLGREGLETIPCDRVDQELLDRAYERMLRADVTDSTRLREVVAPVRAVLRHGAIRGWCTHPTFETIRQPKGRKEWLTPSEAEAIIAASPPHLAPLFEFMFCAGPRRGEVLRLSWEHVQLRYGRATLRDIKSRTGEVKDRILDLEPRAAEALATIWTPGTDGPLFRRADGSLWHSDTRVSGAQLNKAFRTVADGAVGRRVHLHMIRHSWASWHYAVHKNLRKLMVDGAWESLAMADRYAHLAPETMVPEILAFWRPERRAPAH